MNNFSIRTATLTDRGLTAAHGGTAPLASPRLAAASRTDRVKAMSTFGAGSVPAYVVDQESHPPRERSAG